jgi:E3 ubiquitin-protein ligase DOA10
MQIIDQTEEVKCRICWDETGPFIVPCQCKGTQLYVHEVCLRTHILTPPLKGKCITCGTPFNLKNLIGVYWTMIRSVQTVIVLTLMLTAYRNVLFIFSIVSNFVRNFTPCPAIRTQVLLLV